MAQGRGPAVLRQVHTLFSVGAAGSASDEQLLQHFTNRNTGTGEAEAAFAVLVARHGPMVLGVCRRSLRNPEDVADAFQATFLVLVRKAHSVRVRGSLGRWLYGVSRRVAARARVESARRGVREGSGKKVEGEARTEDFGRRELLEALDEEVSRLPEPFRKTVVLCDLHGLNHEAAARQLGCALGTVESRLSRGREKLRERLTRRGFATTPALYQGLVPRLVPEALSAVTVRIALAKCASTPVVALLLHGVLKDMLWTKLKTAAYGILVVGVCGVGVVAAQKAKPEDQPVVAPKAEPKALTLAPPAKMKPGDRLMVEVLQALPGRPISGERMVKPDGTISLGFYGDVLVAGLDRREIKVAVIKRLQKYLEDETLGLEEIDPETGKKVAVSPVDSNSVFVDETLIFEPDASADLMTRRFERLLLVVKNVADHDKVVLETLNRHNQRLIAIEKKVDRLLKAVEKNPAASK